MSDEIVPPAPDPSHAPPITPERASTLTLIVTIPFFGKPDQELPAAQNALRYIQLSVHAEAKVELVSRDGNTLIEVEPSDLWDKATGSP